MLRESRNCPGDSGKRNGANQLFHQSPPSPWESALSARRYFRAEPCRVIDLAQMTLPVGALSLNVEVCDEKIGSFLCWPIPAIEEGVQRSTRRILALALSWEEC